MFEEVNEVNAENVVEVEKVDAEVEKKHDFNGKEFVKGFVSGAVFATALYGIIKGGRKLYQNTKRKRELKKKIGEKVNAAFAKAVDENETVDNFVDDLVDD